MNIVNTIDGTLERHEVVRWCKNFHYARRVPSISFAYGLVGADGNLQAVVTIGKPASNALCEGICGKENKSYVYELNRICAKDVLDVPLSQFVGAVLRSLPDLILVSYADTAWHHVGYIYQALNWIYTGATRARTDIATGKHSRHYEKAESYPDRVPRSSKHRYVMFTGNKRFKKTMRGNLNYKVESYPKGDTQKYDIDWQ